MINRVILVGRLTKDPEYRQTPNGVSVATFTLAVNRPFTNSQGEREADFINVVVFRKQAENVNYLSKGSLAGVDGRVQSRNYENNEGRRVFVTEIVADNVQFMDSKGSNQQNNQSQQQGQASANNNPFSNNNADIDTDDLPFDKPTTKQVKYAEYLQSFLRKDDDLSRMSKKELSDYINSIKPDAEFVIDELQAHTDIFGR